MDNFTPIDFTDFREPWFTQQSKPYNVKYGYITYMTYVPKSISVFNFDTVKNKIYYGDQLLSNDGEFYKSEEEYHDYLLNGIEQADDYQHRIIQKWLATGGKEFYNGDIQAVYYIVQKLVRVWSWSKFKYVTDWRDAPIKTSEYIKPSWMKLGIKEILLVDPKELRQFKTTHHYQEIPNILHYLIKCQNLK